MPLENLNHVLVLTRDLEATRDFYVDVLGLEDGYRPPFPFSGHWIYLGDRAVVHVAENRGYLDARNQVRDGSADSATGSIDHIAFEAYWAQGHDREAGSSAVSPPTIARCRTSTCTRSSSTTRTGFASS